ncbi:RNA polymerase sigma factor [Devosia sp. XJ19-1]|uniref:RNA polymerase sigma factor n=1 Tax=Devosia ureilytica TaxID=2952754 RepID=A0A9Q4AQU8_9HYPH|nr:RNA polymerase sigma factor [Devosia ureilytica]MCP8884579.1 RNA polymerase sigma factor [Devosia ureilytica]MCP8888209.1 RNA polymerase sigma factor [Devosia ureilytica]
MGLTAAPPPDTSEALIAALVLRARQGDGAAFGALIADQYERIYRAAWRWCGNRDDAEDIAQEVCVKIGQGISAFDGRSAFSSWVYRITLNAVRDWQRAGARRGRQASAFAEVSHTESAPEQEASATSRQLWDAVRQLPDKQRDAVLLVYAEELSHAEAATIMGIKEATVSFHVYEARKTLRGLL